MKRALMTLAATWIIPGLVAAQVITTLPNSNLPRKDDKTYMPDEWLLSTGQPWHYKTVPAQKGKAIGVREPTPSERKIVEEGRDLLARHEIKLIALIDEGNIVDISSKSGINLDTLLLSASMGKTVTAVAVGKAVCAGKIRLDSKAGDLVSMLAGKDLGNATLRDLMLMASGVTDPPPLDVTGITSKEVAQYLQGPGTIEELIASPRLSTFQKTVFSTLKPGERFSYKSVDPFAVAMMLQYAVGLPATEWVNEMLFKDIPIKDRAILGTDKKGNFSGAEGGVRLTLFDWVRFAVYVQEERAKPGCFGSYLNDLSRTQIRTPRQDGVNGYFDGYGYFTWTENHLVRNSFWAVGYGGQRIGWSADPANKRIFITFGNSSDKDMNRIYPVASKWLSGK